MPRSADPIQPRLSPNKVYVFQDPRGWEIQFVDGTHVSILYNSDVYSAILAAFPGRYDLYGEVARGEAKVRKLFFPPYEYRPGYSRAK